jgi:hypothetical protein
LYFYNENITKNIKLWRFFNLALLEVKNFAKGVFYFQ